MKFVSPGEFLLEVGPLQIRWYGICIALGIIAAFLYATREARRRNLNPAHLESMAFWVVLAGVVGARLYYVVFNFSYYLAHPIEIFKIWQGGLAIHGALIGGALAFFVSVWKYKISWKSYADCLAPGILLAQGIGRLGNFFNNEAFGRPTDLPWKLFIPEEARPKEYLDFSYFHPTFLYEMLWNFIGFGLLVWLSRKFFPRHAAYEGTIFFSYLMWYSFGRFFIEGLRTDSLYLGPLRAAEVVSIIAFTLGAVGLLFIRKRHKV